MVLVFVVGVLPGVTAAAVGVVVCFGSFFGDGESLFEGAEGCGCESWDWWGWRCGLDGAGVRGAGLDDAGLGVP